MSKRFEIWSFINKHRISKGYSPSYREISKGVNTSKGNVAHHIDRLAKGGWVKKGPKNSVRTVKGSRWGIRKK
jgi:SOS-response transcriptional repressor LexA